MCSSDLGRVLLKVNLVADFVGNGTDIFRSAPVDAHALIENAFAQNIVFHVFKKCIEQFFLRFVFELLRVFFGQSRFYTALKRSRPQTSAIRRNTK